MMLKKLFMTLLCLVFAVYLIPSSFAGTSSYEYDTLHRLSHVDRYDGTVILYEYDNLGNRIRMQITKPDLDNDGIPDGIEKNACTDFSDADTDDDGIPDGTEDANYNGAVDAGETDPCDIDSDSDGIQDGTESGYTLSDIGQDTDTNVFQPDLDPTKTTYPLIADTDDDGTPDGQEDLNHNGRLDSGETEPSGFQIGDIDSNGVINMQDAILALQILAGFNPSDINQSSDINKDNKISMQEAIYIFQKISELRN